MRKLLFLLSVGCCMLLCNCKKETKVQTVTVRDTVYVDTTTIPALISDTTTTFIIMRHAEKESTGTDPNLNTDGLARAEELKRILGNIAVKSIYTTPYNRTRQTVEPLAIAKGISITEYAANKPYAQLINEIATANRGKVAVIVGHSNTVPEILKELSHNTYNVTIGEEQYDNLYIVTLPDSLSPSIVPLKYGKHTP